MITLVIIGVIAAMTVPTLMNKTNNQEYVSKLKKTYSTLAQATNLIIAEEGTPKASVGGWAKDVDTVYNFYKKHLINAKDCGSVPGCFKQTSSFKLLNNYPFSWNWDSSGSGTKKLVLADGTQIMFDANYLSANNDCSTTSEGTKNVCARLWVDINGERKPNKVGRDIFYLALTEKSLVPGGCDENVNCMLDREGYSCACKVLREGAMNY